MKRKHLKWLILGLVFLSFTLLSIKDALAGITEYNRCKENGGGIGDCLGSSFPSLDLCKAAALFAPFTEEQCDSAFGVVEAAVEETVDQVIDYATPAINCINNEGNTLTCLCEVFGQNQKSKCMSTLSTFGQEGWCEQLYDLYNDTACTLAALGDDLLGYAEDASECFYEFADCAMTGNNCSSFLTFAKLSGQVTTEGGMNLATGGSVTGINIELFRILEADECCSIFTESLFSEGVVANTWRLITTMQVVAGGTYTITVPACGKIKYKLVPTSPLFDWDPPSHFVTVTSSGQVISTFGAMGTIMDTVSDEAADTTSESGTGTQTIGTENLQMLEIEGSSGSQSTSGSNGTEIYTPMTGTGKKPKKTSPQAPSGTTGTAGKADQEATSTSSGTTGSTGNPSLKAPSVTTGSTGKVSQDSTSISSGTTGSTGSTDKIDQGTTSTSFGTTGSTGKVSQDSLSTSSGTTGSTGSTGKIDQGTTSFSTTGSTGKTSQDSTSTSSDSTGSTGTTGKTSQGSTGTTGSTGKTDQGTKSTSSSSTGATGTSKVLVSPGVKTKR